ncbi:MAG: hypothetical protein ACI8UR_001310 [Natronomonas sp.]
MATLPIDIERFDSSLEEDLQELSNPDTVLVFLA